MRWFNRVRTPTIDPASRTHWRIAIPEIAAKLELARMRWFKDAIAFLDSLDNPPSFARRDLGRPADMALQAWQLMAVLGQIDRQLTLAEGRNDFIDLLYNEVCGANVSDVWVYQQRYEQADRKQQMLLIAADIAGYVAGPVAEEVPVHPVVALPLASRLLDLAILSSVAVAEDLGDVREAERLVSTLKART